MELKQQKDINPYIINKEYSEGMNTIFYDFQDFMKYPSNYISSDLNFKKYNRVINLQFFGIKIEKIK